MTYYINPFRLALVTITILLFIPLKSFADAEVQKINLVQGQAEVIRLNTDIETVLIGDESIADILVISPESFYVYAKKNGVTNLQVLDGAGELVLVVNIEVGIDLENLSKTLSSALPDVDLDVENSPNGVVLLGWVNSESDRERAKNIALGYAPVVVDAIKVRNQRQVYVQVRFIEISSLKTRELGGDATAIGLLQATKIKGFEPRVSVSASIDSKITALLERGEARYLAAPILTALAGTTSSFLAGGEFPVVTVGSDGQTQTEFKEYGVRLSFTPEINDNGAISLTMEPEVSQVDETRSTPGSVALTTRRARTTTEVKSGETIMLAGLLQSSSSRGIDSIPGLGEMPIIGPLFSKSRAGDSRTELIILVKPVIASPANASMNMEQSMNTRELTDGKEFFIDGKLSRPTYSVQDVVNGKGVTGAFGHILEVHDLER